MKTFKKWNKRYIADTGCTCSTDCKQFYRAFKNYLKRSFPDCEVTGFIANHYDTSGFIKKGDKCIYVSHDIDRSRCFVDFEETDYRNGVLYRTAEHDKDYHGGSNNYTSINNMVADIKKLFERM